MKWKNNSVVLSFVLLFIGVALFGFDFTNAQQMPPSPTTKSAAPTPTPNADDEPIEDDEIIKIDTEVVNVLFTAQDKNRRLLIDLKQSDIRLMEDGQPQEIVSFSRQVDLPLSFAILIDTSASQ